MSGLEIFSYEINGFHKSRRFITKARRFAMNNNISERNQCYGITITADGVDKNGNAFHNAIADVRHAYGHCFTLQPLCRSLAFAS